MKSSAEEQPREQWLPLEGLLKQRKRRWRELVKRVKEWVRELVEMLKKTEINVGEVLLFGSIARGDFKECSDVDLIIISKDWERFEYLDRLRILYRLWSKPVDANFVPVTREELRRKLKSSVTLRDASSYWIRIYPNRD